MRVRPKEMLSILESESTPISRPRLFQHLKTIKIQDKRFWEKHAKEGLFQAYREAAETIQNRIRNLIVIAGAPNASYRDKIQANIAIVEAEIQLLNVKTYGVTEFDFAVLQKGMNREKPDKGSQQKPILGT